MSSTLKVDNITEKTTDSGVTVEGVLIKDGVITTSSPIVDSVDPAITATGSDDTDGYALSKKFNVITGGADNTGVELPTAVAGLEIVVANLTSSLKKVYANASDQIDDKTATTGSITLQPEQVVVFRAYTTALWQSDSEGDFIYETLYVGNGTLAEPALKVGQDYDGLYRLGTNQLGVSMNNALATYFGTGGVYSDDFRPRVAKGTAQSGVTAVESGTARDVTVHLSFTDLSLGAVAGAAAEVINVALYEYPSGAIVQSYANLDVALTATTQTADTPDIGLGTDDADGDAVATLDLADSSSGDAENILTGQTAADCNGTATVKTVATTLVVETGDDHMVYLNVTDGWSGADADVTATGTVTLKYSIMEG